MPANVKLSFIALLFVATVLFLGMKACSALQDVFASVDFNPQQEVSADAAEGEPIEPESQILYVMDERFRSRRHSSLNLEESF